MAHDSVRGLLRTLGRPGRSARGALDGLVAGDETFDGGEHVAAALFRSERPGRRPALDRRRRVPAHSCVDECRGAHLGMLLFGQRHRGGSYRMEIEGKLSRPRR